MIIKKRCPDVITIGLLCEHLSETDKTCSHSFDYLFAAANNLKIAEFITNSKPNILVVIKHTVRDQNVILRAKKAGAMVIELQHGILYEGASLNNFNLHEIFAAALNLRKTLTYLNTLRQMCAYDGQSYANLLMKILIEHKNIAHIIENHFSVKLNADYAMVIGEHWIDYFCENYDYSREKILLMGNHDLDNMVLDKTLEDAICYIPSVHVEDKKIRKSVFVKFLKALAEAVEPKIKFYIKMHPRGDIRLYKEVFANHNVHYITGSEFPYVTTYISHNSTLIAKALMLTNKVILWKFKEETDCFYAPWSYAVCKNAAELKNSIKQAISTKEINKNTLPEIIKISYINPEGALNYAGRNIINLYKRRENEK